MAKAKEFLDNIMCDEYEIVFNKPTFIGDELASIKTCLENGKLSGDNTFSRLCAKAIEKRFEVPKVLLTPSCTAALEMAALLLDIKPGDEVICPSFTFVTTASAFALRGARIVFVDIRPDTLNLDESQLELAITNKTKAIVVVHYAGIACEMDVVMAFARKHNLAVVEDAAQAVGGAYKGQPCGCIGDLGCYSFHETKNIVCGEGGALLVNNPKFIERAEVIREKGTNRSRFFRGQVDKYTWVDIGSSYLLNDISAAYLYPQIMNLDMINDKRLSIWDKYHKKFKKFEEQGLIKRPVIPCGCRGNGHLYYLLFNSFQIRTKFIAHMKSVKIMTVFHYVPLHSSPAGQEFGCCASNMSVTDRVSDCLVRLPIYYALTGAETERVMEQSCAFLEAL